MAYQYTYVLVAGLYFVNQQAIKGCVDEGSPQSTKPAKLWGVNI